MLERGPDRSKLKKNEPTFFLKELYFQNCLFQSLSFSSYARSGSLLLLLNLLLGLLDLGGSSFLGGSGLSGGLLRLLGSTDGLLTLSLPYFGLLVPLGHDILKGGANDGTLELLSPLGTFLGGALLQSLLVLAPVEHGPGDLPGIPLEVMALLGFAGEEFEGLAVGLDQGAAVAGVDLQTRKCAQFNLHFDFLKSPLVEVNQAILAWS